MNIKTNNIRLVFFAVMPTVLLACSPRLPTLSLFIVLSCIIIGFIIGGGRVPDSRFTIIILFGIYLVFNAVFRAESEYGIFKAWYFLIVNIGLCLSILLSMPDKEDFKALVYGQVFLGLCIAGLSVIVQSRDVLGYRYQWIGNLSAISAVLLFNLALSRGISKTKMLKYTILCLICLYAVIISGSRQSLIGLALCTVLLLIPHIRELLKKMSLRRHAKVIVLPISLFLLAWLITRGTTYYNLMVSRFIFLFKGGFFLPHERGQLIKDAIGSFRENFLFGIGSGNYSQISELQYPHNIFLEMLVEVGIIGSAIFLLYILVCLRGYQRIQLFFQSNMVFNVFLITAFFGIRSMMSGDITSNRIFLVWLSLGIIKLSERTPQLEKRG